MKKRNPAQHAQHADLVKAIEQDSILGANWPAVNWQKISNRALQTIIKQVIDKPEIYPSYNQTKH